MDGSLMCIEVVDSTGAAPGIDTLRFPSNFFEKVGVIGFLIDSIAILDNEGGCLLGDNIVLPDLSARDQPPSK